MGDPNTNTESLCTRAITGNVYPTHQPIYICDTCQLYKAKDEGDSSNASTGQEEEMDEPLPSCICQSCALNCHNGHDVSFVGIGPSTCDCLDMVNNNNLGHENVGSGEQQQHLCQLVELSDLVAQRLGFTELRLLNHPLEAKKVPPLLHPMPVANERSDDGTGNEVNDTIKNATLHGDTSQQLSYLCLDCSSTLAGYTYASYTLPGLLENNNGDDNNDNGICQHLIRQAELLIDFSKETFWIPHDKMNCDDINGDYEWCDLEVLAMQIYKQHVQSYSLQASSTIIEEDADNITKSGTTAESGGLEWWVQVKPAGSREPVKLHYDKDEVLAETFGLGSFPSISTVTYLTEDKRNSPTVVFPHTYHDEEDKPIESMLLSHATKAKHLVFDGRLLHGAPAHEKLLRQSVGVDEESTEKDENPLRVTFLVNIWKSGKPAGVNILPDYIRSRIKSSASSGPTASFRSIMPLEFQHRGVSQLSVPTNSSFVEEKIVLPFVSNGYGDDDEVDVEEESEEEDGLTREEQSGGSSNTNDDEVINDDDYEEEDGELVLVLPPFDMPEKADTIILSFEKGNVARLVRDGAFNEQGDTAANFLSYLHEHVPSFVSSIITKLESQHDIDVTTFQADHVCYRTDSIEQYTGLVQALQSSDDDVTLLVESEIGGRLIATFKLTVPIEIINSEDSSIRRIDVIEVPSPKDGSLYVAGLEHVEFVIGDGSHRSALNDGVHQTALNAWIERFPSVSWNTKAIDKACNPDVSTKLELNDYGKVSVKFHLLPLEDVIKFEVDTEE